MKVRGTIKKQSQWIIIYDMEQLAKQLVGKQIKAGQTPVGIVTSARVDKDLVIWEGEIYES